MTTTMTDTAAPTADVGDTRSRAVLSSLDKELTGLAAAEGQRDGSATLSPHTPSPTRGERCIAAGAHRAQRELDTALESDAVARTREIAGIDDISRRVDRGEALHPPLMLTDNAHIGLKRRVPGEMLLLAVVGAVETWLLAGPIQTVLNLESWAEALVISGVIIVLVITLAHLFADARIRARYTMVPAVRDALRPVATGFAVGVILAGVMAVTARAFSQRLADGNAGSELEAWAVFIIFQIVFVIANLMLPVREKDARLNLWLASLRDRRMTLDAAGSDKAIAALRREFWTIVFRALCGYRNELQATNESGLFTAGWDNRTSTDLNRRQLLRQVFPTAPLDPAPDFDLDDDIDATASGDAPEGQHQHTQPRPPPPQAPQGEPLGGHDDPPTPEETAGGNEDDDEVIDLTDPPPATEPARDPGTELDDLIAQVLGEAEENAA